MANIKISELNPLLTVADADVLPIVNNGVTKKVTASVLQSYTQGNSVLLTGAQSIAGVKTFVNQLVSSVATGTAPFSVASTTKVTNLNADLLDGLTSADFQGALTLTTTGSSGASTLSSNTLNVPNYTLSGLGGVPYTGATDDVNLGTHDIYAAKSWLLDEVNNNYGSTHYTDGNYHIEDADGHKLLVIEDGFMQIHKTDTIQSNLYTTDLTETRDHYLPNASGTLALTSDLSSYVPTTRIINTTGALTGGGALSGNLTLSMAQSSGSANGYLSSTDWSTFNAKQAAGNYITALTGEATASGPGSSSVTLTNSAVVGKVLTGLNVTGGSVSATDSVLTAFGKVQNQINGLIGGSIYQSVWNASTNSPTLASGVGTKGYYYIVNVAGSTNLDGITDWKVGDWAIYDGTAWQKVDNTDSVSSVNGQTGAVSLTTSNITEGSNLYFTDARARAAISLTTSGTSGAATYSGGVLNIPQYQAALTNPITGTGTTNYLPKFTGTSALGNSIVSESGSVISVAGNISTINSNGRIILANGNTSSGNKIQSFNGAGNADGYLAFEGYTKEYARFDANGNLGIGTTSPNNLLDLYKASYPVLQISSGTITGNMGIDTSNNFLNVGTSTNHSLVFATNNTERMRITSAGNFGIGTTSPYSKLNVQNGNITITTSDFAVGTTGSILTYGALSSTGNTGFYLQARTAGDSASNGKISINPDGGNVGIGTTSPNGKLSVLDTSTGYSSDSQIKISDTTTNYYGGLSYDDAGSTRLSIRNSYDGVGSVIGFGFGGSSDKVQIIDGTGLIVNEDNVGIGTTNPYYKLVVSNGGALGLEIHPAGNSGTQVELLTYNRSLGVFKPIKFYSEDFEFTTASNQSLTIKNNGNVLIGTTTDAGYKLDVNGDIKLKGRVVINSTTNYSVLKNESTSGSIYWGIDNSAGSDFTGVAYARFIYSEGVYPLITYVNGSERMRIAPSGEATFSSSVTVGNFTTTQINALTPAAGMVVYNTTLSVLCFYDGSGWRKVSHSSM